MQSIKNVQRLNERELLSAVPSSASWHVDYRDTAYIYIGGLAHELSEGDVITIFSQYGDPVWIKLARDKDTGKSRGFAWLKYEDQRSCDLAVDNLSGASVMGKLLAVDHARYQRRKDEDENEGYVGQGRIADEEPERSRRRRSEPSESESEEEKVEEARPMLKEEIELANLIRDHDEDDPMKAYMVQQKKEELDEALKAVVKSDGKEKSHRHRHHRSHKDEDGKRREHRSNGRHEHKSRRHRSRSP